jgi:glycosyltransferase involved in cell wall biosynthesis
MPAASADLPVEPKKSICFVALNSFDLVASRDDLLHLGGAEQQQIAIARHLVARGFEVSFVTKQHDAPIDACFDGIRVVSAYRESDGLPGLRFFYPRWWKLLGALKRVDADIYYQRGSGVETGQIAAWARANGKRFVYACASEGDCIRGLPFIKRRFDRFAYVMGLKTADIAVAQTLRQKSLLAENYNVDATVVRSLAMEDPGERAPVVGNNEIVWAGRFAPVKRLELLLDVARSNGDFKFVIIGAQSDSADPYTREIVKASSALSNVDIIPAMPQPQLHERIRAACAVISTSEIEGFPNVYLEAWARGKVVICSYDPDGAVAQHSLGWVCSSLDDFDRAIDKLRSRTEASELNWGRHVKRYVRTNHHPDAVVPAFITAIRAG